MAKRKKIDFELCLRCQTGGNIVKSPDPDSFENFVRAVTERASYCDNDFANLKNCLGSITAEELVRNNASWHRECYQDAVHPEKILRAKKRYEKQICLKGNELSTWPIRPGRPASIVKKEEKEKQPKPGRIMRSSKPQQDPEIVCFFCGEDEVHGKLHKVRSPAVNERILQTVEKSSNDLWKVKLQPGTLNSASAIGVKYQQQLLHQVMFKR